MQAPSFDILSLRSSFLSKREPRSRRRIVGEDGNRGVEGRFLRPLNGSGGGDLSHGCQRRGTGLGEAGEYETIHFEGAECDPSRSKLQTEASGIGRKLHEQRYQHGLESGQLTQEEAEPSL